MEIILVDTSVWINFFRAKTTDSSVFLKNNIANFIIATCPVIVQEVLQGVISDKEFKKISSYFDTLKKFRDNPYELATDAAKLYRDARKQGFTIRKPNDCLIAAYAIRNDVKLLQDDRDFLYISRYSNLVLQAADEK